MGCYIVEFEQNGEDRAAYGEQLLKKLEKQLNTKGLNERRFREFRRLYLVYPQLKEEVLGYVMSGSGRGCPKSRIAPFAIVYFGKKYYLTVAKNKHYSNG